MKIIVVGAGNVGRTLANMMSAEKHKVAIIEKDEERSKAAADSCDALVIKGDASELNILKDAGIDKADALVAVTDDDKSNLMVCEIAKSLGVRKIISKINDTANEELFSKLAIVSTIPIVGITVTAIKKEIESDGHRVIATLDEGKLEVLRIKIEKKSPLLGKKPSMKDCLIGAVYRKGELINPQKVEKLEEDDMMIVTVKSKDFPKIKKRISEL